MTAPGGPGALPRWLGVAARGGVRAGVRASAGSGVAPGGRATTAVTVVNRFRQGARLVSIRRTQGTVS